jgi:hypothetical protein
LSGIDCDAMICAAQLEAVIKKSAQDESFSTPIAIPTPVELIRIFDEVSLIGIPLHRSPEEQNKSAPLELRPGSSLRI